VIDNGLTWVGENVVCADAVDASAAEAANGRMQIPAVAPANAARPIAAMTSARMRGFAAIAACTQFCVCTGGGG
jgi:hypothetical protein